MQKSKMITLKHLLIGGDKCIGMKFYADKVIDALIKTLPEPKWSNEFSMAYVKNTKANLDLIFSQFKGVAWVNCSHFFHDKPLMNGNVTPSISHIQNKASSLTKARRCPDEYLQKLQLKKYAQNTVNTYVNCFEVFINHYKDRPLMELNENDIRTYLQELVKLKNQTHTLTRPLTQSNSIMKWYRACLIGFTRLNVRGRSRLCPKCLGNLR